MDENKENEIVPKVEVKQSGVSVLITPKWALIGDELLLTNIEAIPTTLRGENSSVNLYTAKDVKRDEIVQFFGSLVMDSQNFKVGAKVTIDQRVSKEGRKYFIFVPVGSDELNAALKDVQRK
ncbi:MAG: hypothetical protein QW735_03685 [archaeon]